MLTGKAVTAAILVGLLLLSVSVLANADIPHIINYQGKLTGSSGNPVAEGSYTMIFKIYDTETGGSPLWEETQSVNVNGNGIFNVFLGGVTSISSSIFLGSPRWLGITIGSDDEITPRRKILSVAYSYVAENAFMLDGQVASTFADSAHNHDSRYCIREQLSISDGDGPNAGSNLVSWDNLTDVPADFADGVDDTTTLAGSDTVSYAWNADRIDGLQASFFEHILIPIVMLDEEYTSSGGWYNIPNSYVTINFDDFKFEGVSLYGKIIISMRNSTPNAGVDVELFNNTDNESIGKIGKNCQSEYEVYESNIFSLSFSGKKEFLLRFMCHNVTTGYVRGAVLYLFYKID